MKHPPEEGGEGPLLLRPQEAARSLALSRSTIYDMIASGELAAVRIGRTLRIPAQALRDWVAENTGANPGRISAARTASEQDGNPSTK